MKKANRKTANDMRPEYDFASMQGGVRGKYAKRYRAGTNLILLDAEYFRYTHVGLHYFSRSRAYSQAAFTNCIMRVSPPAWG